MGILTAVLNTLIVLLSLFLICLVLIQRGRGGGLAGAFGGTGGSSAFGTKAGDTFTKITIGSAAVWMLMTMLLVVLTTRQSSSSLFDDAPTSLTRDLTNESSSSTTTPTTAPAPAPDAAAPIDGAPAPAAAPAGNFPLTPGNEPPPSPK